MTGGRFVPLACSMFVLWAVAAPLDPSRGQNKSDAADLRSYYSGNGLLQRGLHDLAAVEYRQFLETHPDHEKAPVARYGLAVCLFRLSKHQEASKELERLPDDKDFPYAAEVLTMLGQCRLLEGLYDAAADYFQRVLDEHGDHALAAEATAQLGESFYKGGDLKKAVAVCRNLVKRWPESPLCERGHLFCGLAEMGQQRYAQAREQFEAQLQRFPSGQLAEQARLDAARCCHRLGDSAAAEGHYRTLLKNPASLERADALYGLGLLLLQDGKPADADTVLNELLKSFPEVQLIPAARLQKGRALLELGQIDQAEEAFRQSAQGSGGVAEEAEYWIAKCKLRRGANAEAAELLRQALKRFPGAALAPEMTYDRAVALSRDEQHKTAAKVLARFLKRYADHSLAADAMQLLAASEHQLGAYDKSRGCCEIFLEKHPSHRLSPAVSFLAAENAFLMGEYDGACRGYRDFLDRFETDERRPKASFRLGMALYYLERFEDAAPLLEAAAASAAKDDSLRSALLAHGDIQFRRGEWKNAERSLGDYLAGKGNVAAADEALLKLGLARQRQERFEDALAAFERLLAEFGDSPNRLQAMFEKGQALVALGRHSEASAAFEEVLREEKDSRFRPYAANHLASIALKDRRFDEASELLDDLAKNSPTEKIAADALLRRAQALMSAKEFGPAEKAYRRFLKKFADHDHAPTAQAELAISIARQDRFSDALKAMDGVSVGELSESLRSALAYERAWCSRALGDNKAAAKEYRHLLDAGDPKQPNVHALLELAILEYDAKRPAKAAAFLQRILEAAKESPNPSVDVLEQATYRLAVCELDGGSFGEAASLFDEFITRFPTSELIPSANALCGEALFKLNRPAEAVKHLTVVVNKHESDPSFQSALLRLGEALAALQQWTRSEEAFARYLKLFGNESTWYQAAFGLGWARENQGRYDEAVAAYQDVVARHQGPTAARAQFQIGECLFAKNRFEEAARELLKVEILYAYPEWSAAALYEAGRCFDELGKAVEARRQFERVTKEYAETKWAGLAAKKLSEITVAGIPGR